MFALNATSVFTGVEVVIRNLEHPDTMGQFVQGIKGIVPGPTLVRGHQLEKGDPWQLRWDFGWEARDGTPSRMPIGAHIEVLVQSKDGRQSSLSFYPKLDSPFVTAEHPGDFYFTQVLDPFRKLAGFDPATKTFAEGEGSAAKIIAKQWIKAFKDTSPDDAKRMLTDVEVVPSPNQTSGTNNAGQDPATGSETGALPQKPGTAPHCTEESRSGGACRT